MTPAMTMLSVGTKAPLFALPLEPGEAPLRLEDYRGEQTVVLLFFPLAFSPGCTKELCAVCKIHASLKDLGAEVVGISVDSPFVNQRFAEEIGASFPILSDFNKDVATAYGVRNDNFFGMKGVSDRSVFVIDPDGIITYAWTTEDSSVLPDLDEVTAAVRG